MAEYMTKLGENGRIVLPAPVRKALDLATGDELILVLEDDSVRVMTARAGVKRAQDIVRQYIPEGTLTSDALLLDRRVEAADEG